MSSLAGGLMWGGDVQATQKRLRPHSPVEISSVPSKGFRACCDLACAPDRGLSGELRRGFHHLSAWDGGGLGISIPAAGSRQTGAIKQHFCASPSSRNPAEEGIPRSSFEFTRMPEKRGFCLQKNRNPPVRAAMSVLENRPSFPEISPM